MTEQKLPKLLNELAKISAGPVRSSLAEEIKNQIPTGLARHRARDTVNIVIDLRVSKIAAAAVIILTMLLWANFLRTRDATSGGIYQDCRLVMSYLLGGTGKDVDAIKPKYEYLVQHGIDVAYYGDSIGQEDGDAVLMQWKLPDGKYRVIFGDLTESEVSAEELIKLQSQMLQKRSK